MKANIADQFSILIVSLLFVFIGEAAYLSMFESTISLKRPIDVYVLQTILVGMPVLFTNYRIFSTTKHSRVRTTLVASTFLFGPIAYLALTILAWRFGGGFWGIIVIAWAPIPVVMNELLLLLRFRSEP